MELQSGHLSDAQIEQYGTMASLPGPNANDRDRAIEVHLADCSACRGRMLAFERTRLALLADPNMSSGPNARRPGSPGPNVGPDCASEDDLRDLAAGVYPADKALAVLQHASLCPRCGQILREYSEDFSDDFIDADKQVLAKLKSSSAEWQKNLVEEMRTGSGRTSRLSNTKVFSWRWVMAPAGLAVCAVVGVVFWYQQRETPERAESLLAQAYTERRTTEMRLAGAEWSPTAIPRGTAAPKPFSLLEAAEIVDRRAEEHPQDIRWLRAKAEEKLIEGDYPGAISILNPAIQDHPDAVPILLDLAIAYYEQGRTNRDNYERALNVLNKTLQLEPGNTVALFNRALVYERLDKIDQAKADWEAALKVERDQGWSDEAKKRLRDLGTLR